MRFVSDEQRQAALERLARAGVLIAELDLIDAGCQGRIAALVHEAIERALAEGGAAPQGVGATLGRPGNSGTSGIGRASRQADGDDGTAGLDAQLHRAGTIGAIGLAISIGPLRAAADPSGVLVPDDSAVLRVLSAAARERPVFVLLDARDGQTRGHGAPITLDRLLGTKSVSGAPAGTYGAAIESPPAPPRRSAPDLSPIATASSSESGGSEATATAAPWPGSPSVWAQQLTLARGPQPLTALERLFCESYVPLDHALAAGLDDPRARGARDEFRCTFVRSYTDAFATFAATTKRPRMVLDAHEVAGRIARLHGARSVRLLLVDAMRWDIGRQIQERLTARLGSRAALADEVLLWSALPTVTMRQLETLARGVEALRAPSELDPDAEPLRGRTAEYVRRLRVGPREIHKLDLVETRLHGARGSVLQAMPDIASEAAEVIARHADSLAPHTLLFVFGDHGFTLDRHGNAQQGGASPEEVLVAGFALLVGDVH